MAPFKCLLPVCAVIVSGSVQAADLPVLKAAPVEYVRICSTHGAGFFYVPGTDSCLRISARFRADFRYLEPFTRARDSIGLRARGRINFDHRTTTDYGQLRTYIRYEIDRNSGVFNGNGDIETNPKLQEGFIQFGGLTAGRVTSFFSDVDVPAPNFGDLRFDDPANADVDLIAYTYTFGNGFSATLSLEDGLSRRINNDLVFAQLGVAGVPALFAPIPFTYGGNRVPDLVANVRYTGSWGGAQLSGVVHQIRDVAAGLTTAGGATVPVVNPISGLPNPTFADTEYGFGLAFNLYVDLPFLGAADVAWLSATYTDGAVGYINAGQASPIGQPADGNGTIGAGPLSLPFTDAFVDPFTGEFKTNKAYGVAGGVNHYWTPNWQTNVFGSWMRFDAPAVGQVVVPTNAATLAAGVAGTLAGVVDFNEYRIGTNTIWSPVTGLRFGLEALYTRVDPRGRVAVPLTNVAGDASGFFKPTGSGDIWEGRFRVQRDF